jgi:hypothetical protein
MESRSDCFQYSLALTAMELLMRQACIVFYTVLGGLEAVIWTRYYELGTKKPLFCDRDSEFLYSLAEVSLERHGGYAWYTNSPQKVLDKYSAWQKKHAPNNDVLKTD